MSAIYSLHKHHRQFLLFQNLKFDLKMLSLSEYLMLLSKSFHIFGPKKNIASEPIINRFNVFCFKC